VLVALSNSRIKSIAMRISDPVLLSSTGSALQSSQMHISSASLSDGFSSDDFESDDDMPSSPMPSSEAISVAPPASRVSRRSDVALSDDECLSDATENTCTTPHVNSLTRRLSADAQAFFDDNADLPVPPPVPMEQDSKSSEPEEEGMDYHDLDTIAASTHASRVERPPRPAQAAVGAKVTKSSKNASRKVLLAAVQATEVTVVSMDDMPMDERPSECESVHADATPRPSESQLDSQLENEVERGVQVVALFDFAGEEEGELSFKAGDVLVQFDCETERGWHYGMLRSGASGAFPASYVQPL
jgi:hypothetical protein